MKLKGFNMKNEPSVIDIDDIISIYCDNLFISVEVFNEYHTMEDVLEYFISQGDYNEIVSVEGSEPENAARIDNWILWTDSQGFKTAEEFECPEDAEENILWYDGVVNGVIKDD
jgi:hypothetical protein